MIRINRVTQIGFLGVEEKWKMMVWVFLVLRIEFIKKNV